MRFEKEKTFDIGRRVARWMDNAKQFRKADSGKENTERVSAIAFAKNFD